MARLAIRLLAGAALACGGCATAGVSGETPASAPASVAPVGETTATADSDANTAIIIPRGQGDALIVGTSEAGGLEVYGLNGARLSAIPAGAPVGVDARYGSADPGGAGSSWVLAALDSQGNKLRLFDFNAEAGSARELTARDIPLNISGESLCLYRDARDATLYAFALGGSGEISQYMVFSENGRLDARLVRQLRLPSEVSYCAADDESGQVYVAEQAVGVWRFDANPEAETVPALIDAARLGRITEEAGGLAIYRGGDANYLIASDASANTLHLYDRNQDDAYVGSILPGAPEGAAVDGVEAAGGMAASSLVLGGAYSQGLLVATDDSNDAGTNYKLLSWANIAGALSLATPQPQDPRAPVASDVAIVHPTMETRPVETDGDAADDPAIWIDAANPSRSVIIGTQKQSGLYVYDLQGNVLQFVPDGRMNNVDLRNNFSLGGERVTLVTASNRSNDSISIYRFDPRTRQLTDVGDGLQATGFVDPYGLCMYQSAANGRTYVFIGDSEGASKQWELVDAGNGRVRANEVRSFRFDTQSEGCVADDETGVLYWAEEDVGLWRLGAEPDAGDARTSIATVAENPNLHDDLEGIGIYALEGGRGYLVLSSQGDNTYAVFRREGANEYVGSFAVVGDGARGIDGISETDGLEVTSLSGGAGLESGFMVAQDGRNIMPPEFQNFKLVPWSTIAERLGLEQR